MIPKRRVFITGGTGFIGKVLIQQLLAAVQIGEVVALTRDHDKVTRVFPSNAKLRTVTADLLQTLPPECFEAPIDAVFHLAGLKLDSTHPQPNSAYQRLNHDAALGLAQAAARAGVKRFIFFSSTGVYGTTGSGRLDESSPCQPDNVYERTKLAAEHSLEQFARTTSMAITVLRPSNVFGPTHPRQHLLTLMRTIQRGWLVLPRRDGWTNYVAADDVADAALRLSLRPASATPEFQRLIANCPMRVGEFASEIAAALAVRPRFLRVPNPLLGALGAAAEGVANLTRHRLPITRRKVRELSRSDYYSSDRLQAEVSDWPRTGLRTAIQETIKCYRAGGLL